VQRLQESLALFRVLAPAIETITNLFADAMKIVRDGVLEVFNGVWNVLKGDFAVLTGNFKGLE